MPTIVDYSAKRPARNRYPKKIISPPSPRECCLTQMQRIGGRQVEENSRRWYFFYKRCTRCGFTVREFMSSVEMYRLLPVEFFGWDQASSNTDRIQGEVPAEVAA